MNPSHTDRFFSSFSDSFRQVLSQCSGTDWSAVLVEAPEAIDLIWVIGSASGSLTGEFALGFSQQTGILFAQALMMSAEPAVEYSAEEKEAAVELLRQVCGLCATALADSNGQPTLSVNIEASLAWSPAERRGVQITQGNRTATITVAISPELIASFSPRTVEPSSEPVPASQTETDRPALQEAIAAKNLDLLMDVHLGVRLRFGSRRMKLREILEFHPGTIVELDRQVQDPVDLLVDNKLIARGEVVVVDGNYGLKVNDVLSPKQCVEALY